MEKKKVRQPGFLAAAVICFIIGILAYSGVILWGIRGTSLKARALSSPYTSIHL